MSSRTLSRIAVVVLGAFWAPLVCVLSLRSEPLFDASLEIKAGDEPVSVAFGDLDGDGNLDLAATNYGGSYYKDVGSVCLLLGNGDGTFRPAVEYEAGERPRWVAIRDLNGDGILDLVVTDRRWYSDMPGRVYVFLGNGDGTLQGGIPYEVGSYPWVVVIGDLDADACPDLVTANQGDGSLSVLMGHGDGSFATPVSYDVGESPSSVAIHDLDRDGSADLAVTKQSEDRVSVLMGHGDGSFATPVSYDVGDYPRDVTAHDLNQDGFADLVVVNDGSEDVSVLLGNGDGTFQPPLSFAAGDDPRYLAVGDLDGDGRQDLAVTNYRGDDISILLGNGDGTFRPSAGYRVGRYPYGLALGDVDANGTLDLAVACDRTVSVLMGNGDGSFPGAAFYDAGDRPGHLVAGDFDGDNAPDLMVIQGTSYGTGVSLLMLRGDGLGSFLPGEPFSFPEIPVGVDWPLTAGDLNADGRQDLLVFGYTLYSFGQGYPAQPILGIFSLLGNGDGTFSDATGSPAAYGMSATLSDFDGDGYPDMAMTVVGQFPFCLGWTLIYHGSGDGTFRFRNYYLTGIYSHTAAAGDLDGDGVSDLVVLNGGTVYWLWSVPGGVTVLLGNGDGSFRYGGAAYAGEGPISVAIDDFNTDAIPDLAVGNQMSEDISVLLGNGDGTFLPAVNYPVGDNPTVLLSGDVDVDGFPDLALLKKEGGCIGILLGNGSGDFADGGSYGVSGLPTSLAMEDLNRDGAPELITNNPYRDGVSVLINVGGHVPAALRPNGVEGIVR